MNGGITAEFPGDPPERKQPEIKNEFEGASVTDAHTESMRKEVEHLESERKEHTAHLDHTPGGTVEQVTHTDVRDAREADIRAMKEQIARHEERQRSR